MLTLPLRSITVHSLALLFVAAVVITSRLGGMYPGVTTAFVSVLIFDWSFDNNPHPIDLNLAGLVRAGVFLGVSVLVAGLEKQRRTAIALLTQNNQKLHTALEEIRVLRGILPICMHCEQIRNKEGTWIRLEEYIQAHSRAKFTHSLCPTCYPKYYPDFYAAKHPE